ncbi:hypothetical protein ACTMU2_19950 [Cupriavidus basilensis]
MPLAIGGETRTDFSVTETSTGKQFRFVLPGPTVTQAEWRACLDYFATLTPPRYLVLSGSLPPGVPVDFYATLSRSAGARGTRSCGGYFRPHAGGRAAERCQPVQAQPAGTARL